MPWTQSNQRPDAGGAFFPRSPRSKWRKVQSLIDSWVLYSLTLTYLLMNADVKPLVIREVMYVAPMLVRRLDIDLGRLWNPHGLIGTVKCVGRITNLASHSRKTQIT